jgi:glutathione S-transferase
MKLRLFVVHGSHPCVAVMKGLDLKGLSYRVVEWPPPTHPPLQRLIFGARTVPGLRIGQNGSAERISGSRAIMHRLDELAPDPALYPLEHDHRARVEQADQWGDEVFQPVARELVWAAMRHSPHALVSYGEHSRLPLPAPAVRFLAPAIAAAASRLNRTDAGVARRDLQELPAQLDRVDAWMADGTMGDPQHPNAADLQILSTVRLLLTLADVRPLLDGRPSSDAARRLFPDWDGEMPAGSLTAA